MKPPPFIMLILFACLFLTIGAVTLVWGISSSQTAIASAGWPTAPGTVTASWVETYISTSSATSTVSGERTTSTFYKPVIQYSYSAGGRKITGSQVSFGEYSSTDSQHAEEVTGQYPPGRAVTVFYDPKDRAQAVLEPGFGSMLLIPLGLGGVFTLTGGLMLAGTLVAIRRGRF
jgi:hypothetical protein